MRNTIPLVLALAPLALSSAGGQGLSDANLRLAPQYAGYTLDQAGGKLKVSESSIPIAFSMPLTSRLGFDVATAFANASVTSQGTKSTISGLTDTQIRLNLTMGSDALVITAGLNLPSGQYEVAEDKIAAASQIGNDFLSFPILSFGNGLAGTGGIAYARPVGTWNLGLGASFRKSAEFGAYKTSATAARFTPADEMRFRAGVDHAVGEGRVVLGLVYSNFGEDACAGCAAGTTLSTYSTGDRLIGQAGLDLPVGEKKLYIGGWLLHHASGENLNGAAPAQNIENLQVALGLNAGTLFLEPSIEERLWQVDGSSAGTLTYLGVRTKFTGGSLEFSPSVAYATGSLKLGGNTDISGFKGGVTIRLVR